MNSDTIHVPQPAKRRRLFWLAFVTFTLIGGIIAAANDITLMRRTFAVLSAMSGVSEASTPAITHVTITWFHGLINLGRVEHPYVWAGIGGFLYGALATALVFLLGYGLIRAVRKILSRRSPEKLA